MVAGLLYETRGKSGLRGERVVANGGLPRGRESATEKRPLKLSVLASFSKGEKVR